MDYTVCSKVVNKASVDYNYAYKLLIKLITDNKGHKVTKNDFILDDYESIAESSEVIRTWIKGMDYYKIWKEVKLDSAENKYIETCRRTYDKTIIVDEKEDYCDVDYEGLIIFNKDEAINQLHHDNNITITDSVVATNGSQIKKVRK